MSVRTTPTSVLYLLQNVDLDPDYNNTITFADATAQNTYFTGKVYSTFAVNTGYTYIRDNDTIKVKALIDDLEGVNYIMYKNVSKWYYAFITKKEYINNNTTLLNIKIDIMQTYQFNYTVEESFVDREHQDRYNSSLAPIYNLETENLEIGDEYNVDSTTVINNGLLNHHTSGLGSIEFFYLVTSTEPLGKLMSAYNNGTSPTFTTVDDIIKTQFQSSVDGAVPIEDGVYCYLIPSSYETIYKDADTAVGLSVSSLSYLDAVAGITEDSRVISIRAIPYINKKSCYYDDNNKLILSNSGADRFGTWQFCEYDPTGSNPSGCRIIRLFSVRNGISLNETITDTLPSMSGVTINSDADYNRESKLLTNPYSYFRVNFLNEYKIYKRENFTSTISFEGISSMGNNGSNIIYPLNYNGKTKNFGEMLQPKNNMDISLRTDAWQNYQLNNKASMNGALIVSGIQTLAGIGIGLATGGLGLAVAGSSALGFAGEIANNLMQRSDLQQKPDEIRPSINDTVMSNLQYGLQMEVEKLSIKDIFKQKVGKYFIHYGYACRNFKKPSLKSRYYFNYIKTIGANIHANIDSDIIAEISRVYDRGITLWHYRSSATFRGVNDYAKENLETSLIS